MDITKFSPEQIERIRQSVNEAVKMKNQIAGIQESIKDISDSLKEDLEIATAEFNKVVTTVYKNSLDEQKADLDQLELNIDVLFGRKCQEDEE